MNQKKTQGGLAGKTVAAFCLGLASAVLGIMNYLLPDWVTPLSIIGFLAGAVGLVLAIMVRKAKPDKPPLGTTVGFVAAIVGVLWNLAFFVACSNLACGGANIF